MFIKVKTNSGLLFLGKDALTYDVSFPNTNFSFNAVNIGVVDDITTNFLNGETTVTLAKRTIYKLDLKREFEEMLDIFSTGTDLRHATVSEKSKFEDFVTLNISKDKEENLDTDTHIIEKAKKSLMTHLSDSTSFIALRKVAKQLRIVDVLPSKPSDDLKTLIDFDSLEFNKIPKAISMNAKDIKNVTSLTILFSDSTMLKISNVDYFGNTSEALLTEFFEILVDEIDRQMSF